MKIARQWKRHHLFETKRKTKQAVSAFEIWLESFGSNHFERVHLNPIDKQATGLNDSDLRRSVEGTKTERRKNDKEKKNTLNYNIFRIFFGVSLLTVVTISNQFNINDRKTHTHTQNGEIESERSVKERFN